MIVPGKNLVMAARLVATEAHRGQFRWSGAPYITHPEAVMAQLPTWVGPIGRAAALLHDVPEDTSVTVADLRAMEFPELLCQTVDHLTHRKGESYAQYIKRVGECYPAIAVKIADLEHNSSDLKEGPRKDKYDLALLYLRSKL